MGDKKEKGLGKLEPTVINTPNPKVGWRFLIGCFALLATLVSGYLWLHCKYPVQKQSISEIKLKAFALSLESLSDKEMTRDEAIEALFESYSTQFNESRKWTEELSGSLTALKVSINNLRFNAKDKAFNTEEITTQLDRLMDLVNTKSAEFAWSEYPWLFLELWFWGALGIVLRKIMRAGWYLRQGRFYQQGIPMHLAHLVVAPILAVMAVLFLSFISFRGEDGTAIILTGLTTKIGLVFLLSIDPWRLWNRLLSTNEKLLKPKEKIIEDLAEEKAVQEKVGKEKPLEAEELKQLEVQKTASLKNK